MYFHHLLPLELPSTRPTSTISTLPLTPLDLPKHAPLPEYRPSKSLPAPPLYIRYRPTAAPASYQNLAPSSTPTWRLHEQLYVTSPTTLPQRYQRISGRYDTPINKDNFPFLHDVIKLGDSNVPDMHTYTLPPVQHTVRTVVPAECPGRTRAIFIFNIPLRHTFNNVCIRQYLNTQKLLSLSIVDPTWAARILLDRGDVAATTEDGALLVTRKSVHPTTIYTDHKVNDTCFELLPIQINDHIWFSVTNSNDLVHFSAEVPCPYVQPAEHTFKQQLLPPNILEEANAKPFIFNTAFMYHHVKEGFAHSTQYNLNFCSKNIKN